MKLVVSQFSSQKEEEEVDMETEGSEATPGENSTPRKAGNAAAGSKTEENSLKAKGGYSAHMNVNRKWQLLVVMVERIRN